MAHGLSEQHYTSYEDTKNWVDSWIASKDEAFFRRGMLPERWKKVVAMDNTSNKTLGTFFHNKCPIFDKKRRKLIYIPIIFCMMLSYVITVQPPAYEWSSTLHAAPQTERR